MIFIIVYDRYTNFKISHRNNKGYTKILQICSISISYQMLQTISISWPKLYRKFFALFFNLICMKMFKLWSKNKVQIFRLPDLCDLMQTSMLKFRRNQLFLHERNDPPPPPSMCLIGICMYVHYPDPSHQNRCSCSSVVTFTCLLKL